MRSKLTLFALLLSILANAQQEADKQPLRLTGDLETFANFFIADSLIGAYKPIPQYDRQLTGTEAWLTLNASYQGFDIGMRFDAFNNSNLYNPNGSYSALGIGRWHIRKKIQNLDITAGYIYDQIGSGIAFRSFESRPLFIDNALVGVRGIYSLGQNWKIKGFSGKQKKVDGQTNLFEVYEGLIMGASLDGFVKLSDSSNISIAPGVGVVKRTLDDATMDDIVGNINTDSLKYRFVPTYNTYAISLYNTFVYKDFTWYVEGAYKSAEAILDNDRNLRGGGIHYKLTPGWVGYTNINYATNGFSASLSARVINNFSFRETPVPLTSRPNRAQIAFLPALQRFSTFRLNARYGIAAYEFGEWGILGDILWSPGEGNWSLRLDYAHINNLTDNSELFREANVEFSYKFNKNQKGTIGFQALRYNQKIYQQKPDLLDENVIVVAYTPFAEFTQKFNRKYSLRLEAQYMNTKQDLGSWAFLQAELSVSPNWSFTMASLVNLDPRKQGIRLYHDTEAYAPILYPTLAVAYSHKANRFSLSYVKQPQGVVCTGGICRLEPAFSGVRFAMQSRF